LITNNLNSLTYIINVIVTGMTRQLPYIFIKAFQLVVVQVPTPIPSPIFLNYDGANQLESFSACMLIMTTIVRIISTKEKNSGFNATNVILPTFNIMLPIVCCLLLP